MLFRGHIPVAANTNCLARDLYEATSFGVGGSSEAAILNLEC